VSDEGTQVANRAADEGRQVASQAADEARDLTSTAAERGGEIVRTAKQDARQIVGTVKERAGEVTEQISSQTRSLAEETKSQLESQAREGTQRLAGAFRQFGEQAQALAEGRPEDAPTLSDYVFRAADVSYGAADRLSNLGDDIEARGFTGVLQDLQGFARRRPGAFLLGAAVLGVGVGRMVKAQSSQDDDEDEAIDVAPRAIPARSQSTRARTVR
jgi:uncharacterized protein YjbJ (UPF0337 family)